MSLQVLDSLIQGTPEWHDQRRGMVTASVMFQLITTKTLKPASNDISRGLTMTLAAERLTGHTDPTYTNADMWRGIDEEPIARDLYSKHFAQATECGFMVNDDHGFKIGYSPDGLVGDDGLIEIKSRRQKKQMQTILADGVPAENIAQLQAGLLVSGREWIDYVSYSNGMPLYVKRVRPDERWFEAIITAAKAFEANVAEMTALYVDAVAGMPKTERRPEYEEMRVA